MHFASTVKRVLIVSALLMLAYSGTASAKQLCMGFGGPAAYALDTSSFPGKKNAERFLSRRSAQSVPQSSKPKPAARCR
jgi:hypothetical protein